MSTQTKEALDRAAILRRPQVEALIGLSRSVIYTMVSEGRFPRPVRLGKRAVGWRSGDVAAWLAARGAAQ